MERNQCPKCGFQLPKPSVECPRCGIIFAKYKPQPEKPETKKCPYCAEEIKADSAKCPFCRADLLIITTDPGQLVPPAGIPAPETPKKEKPDPKLATKGFVYLAAIVFGLGYWAYSSWFPASVTEKKAVIQKTTAQKPAKPTAATRSIHDPCRTVRGYFAATSEPLLKKVISMAVVDDREAMARLMLDHDGLILLKGGDEVFVEDRKLFSGIVEIRPKGKTIRLWTVTEAVDCD